MLMMLFSIPQRPLFTTAGGPSARNTNLTILGRQSGPTTPKSRRLHNAGSRLARKRGHSQSPFVVRIVADVNGGGSILRTEQRHRMALDATCHCSAVSQYRVSMRILRPSIVRTGQDKSRENDKMVERDARRGEPTRSHPQTWLSMTYEAISQILITSRKLPFSSTTIRYCHPFSPFPSFSRVQTS